MRMHVCVFLRAICMHACSHEPRERDEIESPEHREGVREEHVEGRHLEGGHHTPPEL